MLATPTHKHVHIREGDSQNTPSVWSYKAQSKRYTILMTLTTMAKKKKMNTYSQLGGRVEKHTIS